MRETLVCVEDAGIPAPKIKHHCPHIGKGIGCDMKMSSACSARATNMSVLQQPAHAATVYWWLVLEMFDDLKPD